MKTTTRRFGVELRAEMPSEGKLVGHAAVFDQVADVGQDGYEVIERGAFDAVLRSSTTDVVALVNHDPAMLLARQSAGTLHVDVDERGLTFEVDLPDTSYSRDLQALVARGDLTGASFGFAPGQDRFYRSKDGRRVRAHTEISWLRDISPVTFPAYDGTDAALRSLDIGPLGPPSSSNRSKLVRARARLTLPTARSCLR